MKGLLTKDFFLLFQRKQTILIFIIVCIVMGLSSGLAFVVGFMTFVSTILAISTISYDEADHGMAFLMTLPVDRRTYVHSKYLLGIILGAAGWLAGLMAGSILGSIQGMAVELREEFWGSIAVFLLAFIILDLMIPLQLKYGAEKSRVVLLIIFGIFMALAYGMGRIMGDEGIELLLKLNDVSETVILLVLLALALAGTIISILISRHVMERKQY